MLFRSALAAAASRLRLYRAHRNRLAAAASAIREPGLRLLWRLRQPLPQSARLPLLHDAMRRAASTGLERAHTRIAGLERSLVHLNPQAVLGRGYAIVTTADGTIVDTTARLAVGDAIGLEFAHGTADAKVTRLG